MKTKQPFLLLYPSKMPIFIYFSNANLVFVLWEEPFREDLGFEMARR